MAKEHGYRQLEVWQHAMTLVELTYGITERLPATQRFSLADQMQRAAVSVPSNIAEGHGRQTTKDYRRHLRIASGSLCELETQIELVVRLNFVERESIRATWDQSQRVARMLNGLIRAISRRVAKKIASDRQRPPPSH